MSPDGIMVALSIIERIQLAGVLPVQADFLTLSVKERIAKKVEFTEEEIKQIDLVGTPTDQGTVNFTWDVTKEFEKSIEFTDIEHDLIVKQLKELDSKKELNENSMKLYKKFVVGT